MRSLLVVSETALALMLAVGAGLMIRSFEALNSVEPGFEAEGLYCGDLYTHRLTVNTYLHIAQSMVTMVTAATRPAGGA